AFRLQKTHGLPTPRPQPRQPERQREKTLFEWDHAILLEQRRGSGIRRGSWTLPHYAHTPAVTLACRQLGTTLRPEQKMASMLHTFSHFKLHINPWHVKPTRTLSRPEATTTQQRVPLSQLKQTALPAPVRKLIDGLYAHPITSAQD